MIGSVYIKDGNIHFYNENRKFTDIGGIAYILGKPLLDFVCYEPERFDDAFSIYASMFDNPFAYQAINNPVMVNAIKDSMSRYQQHEVYVYFYMRMFMEFVYTFTDTNLK